ncbi:MAG: DUF87 domain-containing protein [Acidobacteria bacterium]|nr:DUF87 domain-containing protein [Acidobacteriota bacterium]
MIDLFKPKEGALSTYVPYWGFVADDVVLTTDGQFLFFAEVTPDSVDGRAPADLDVTNQAWQRLLGLVQPPHRAFIVFERPPAGMDTDGSEGETVGMLAQRKRRAWVAGRVRQMNVYLVLAMQPGLKATVRSDQSKWWMRYVREWFSGGRQKHLSFHLREIVDRALTESRSLYSEIETLVEQYTPLRALRGDDIGALLFRVVNQGQGVWTPMKRPSRYGLNWRVAGETVAFERKHMLVGDRVVAVFSMALPPPRSAANALGELYALPYDFTAVMEWRPLDKIKALSHIRSVQKHYNTQRWSFWAAMSQTEGSNLALDDAPSGAAVDQLYRAALELDTVGVPYGELSLSVAVAGWDQAELDQVGGLVQRVFTQADGKAVKERFGQTAIWFGRFPGQKVQPLARPILVSSGQAASLAPLFGGARGYTRCEHLDKPPLTQFETRWGTPYGYDLFGGGDVGHTLVLGATGSGKSFLLNFLLQQALQYAPRVMILDLGGSYRWLTRLLGGSYLSMKPEADGDGEASQPGLRPFSLPPGERTYSFLASWVQRLLAIGKYECEAADIDDIRKRIADTYAYPVEDRTLGTLVQQLPPRMKPPMSRWIEDGPWAPTFDGAPDEKMTVGEDDWQVIDLAGATEHPDWCAAALFYLFERLRLVIDDDAELGRLKLMVVDEAWRYLADPAVLTVLTEAAKTWRKRNAALVMATQSVVDLTASEQSKALLEMLPTRLLLANPSFPQAAADALQLSEAEYETVRGLEPKKEMFLLRALEKVVLRLTVDPETYWLSTSSASEAAVREEMVDRHGLAGALARLAAGERPGDKPGRREMLS